MKVLKRKIFLANIENQYFKKLYPKRSSYLTPKISFINQLNEECSYFWNSTLRQYEVVK